MIGMVKSHWRASLFSIIIVFALAIGGTFYYFGLENPAIPLTLIAVLPITVYYLYSEVLDRPLIQFTSLPAIASVAPMFVQFNNSPNDFLRPVIFVKFQVTNAGKSTATRSRVLVRLRREDGKTYQYFARWAGAENPVEYDLLPGQDHNVQIAKIFITHDFYERISGLKRNIAEQVDDLDDMLITPSGNPSGRLRELSKLDENTLKFSLYTPKELRPERVESSIHGGWEGTEIDVNADNISDTYSIDAKVIADDYRTGWVEKVDQFSVAELIGLAMDDEDLWQDQWVDGGLSEVIEKARYSLKNWIDDHQRLMDK